MHIDVDTQINAVTRTVGSRTWQAGQVRTVTISQRYDTDPDDLWDAVTNAERLPRWFLPVSGELKVGGRFQLEGNAGGTIEECEPGQRLLATWEFGGGLSWIEVRLTPEDGATRLELEHIAVDSDPEHWAKFGPGAVGIGWDGALSGLALHLSTGTAIDQQQAQAWMASDEGRRFYTASGERWKQAHLDAGDDPETVAGMAQRCIAAFTATPEGA